MPKYRRSTDTIADAVAMYKPSARGFDFRRFNGDACIVPGLFPIHITQDHDANRQRSDQDASHDYPFLCSASDDLIAAICFREGKTGALCKSSAPRSVCLSLTRDR
jgi:hypothetical protein